MISCQGCQGSHFRQRLLATRGAARLTQWNRRLLLLQLGMDPAQNFVNFGQVAFFRVRPVKNFKWLPIRQTKDSMKHESDRGSSCSWAWTRLKTLAKLPSCKLHARAQPHLRNSFVTRRKVGLCFLWKLRVWRNWASTSPSTGLIWLSYLLVFSNI